MIGQEFSKALLGVYNGEQFGEAFFNRLLPTAENQMQNLYSRLVTATGD